VILPAQWDTWDAAQLEAVLLHEQEHVRRRDPLVHWLALLNRAVFWFHPLAWWLERRLSVLAEEACDAAVLSRGYQPTEYAECLLRLARAVMAAGTRVRVVGTAMPGAFLSRRIRRILNAAPEPPISPRRLACTVAACVVAAAVVATAAVPRLPADAASLAGSQQASTSPADTRPLSEYWHDDDEWHLEVASIMTAAEGEAYSQLKTVGERDSFIAAFWKRRDARPDTAANEYQAEFERRLAYVKATYANPDSAATFGYQTDRGRWYVASGPPDAIVPGSASEEEWHYGLLPTLGPNVVVRFDPASYLGCSYRGGRYRIVSPGAMKRYESSGSRVADSRRALAMTYAGGFVYLSLPIDTNAIGIRWGMRAASGVEQSRDEPRGPIDYVQGTLGWLDDPSPGDATDAARSARAKPILAHLAAFGDGRLFEPDGIACTEQLPADTYTLWIETRQLSGERREETVTFEVD
jgi:GWxTD domain-containing protein